MSDRSKPLKRYTPGRWVGDGVPDGLYIAGLTRDGAAELGLFVTEFAFLEITMSDLMAALINDVTGEIGQAVWAAQNSNIARHRLMKTLLEEHKLAKDLGEEVDSFLAEFSRLTLIRNEFVHGLWHFEQDRSETYLTPKLRPNGEYWAFQPTRRLAANEIRDAITAIDGLRDQVRVWHRLWKVAQADLIGPASEAA